MNNEYFRLYHRARYAQRMEYAKSRLGNRCAECGGGGPFDLDHIDPTTKVMPVSLMTRLTKTRFDEELAKCQLLCKPCHGKKTSEENRKRFSRNGGREA